MKREFVLLALKANTDGNFNLENLKEAGRMDLVCRTISNALCISNDLRRGTVVHAVLTGPSSPPKVITIDGDKVEGLEPDERTVASIIKKSLKAGLSLMLNEEKEVSRGIKVAKKAFETLIKEKAKDYKIFYLEQNGKDISKVEFGENNLFIFGDYIGLPKNTKKLILRLGAEKISLGPVMLFASHCPVIVHNFIDRRTIA